MGCARRLVFGQGRRLGVVTYRGRRRDFAVYDEEGVGADSIAVTDEEADALAEILGAPQVTRVLAELQRQAAGLVIEQLPLPAGSPLRPTRNGPRSRIVRVVAPPGAPPSG